MRGPRIAGVIILAWLVVPIVASAQSQLSIYTGTNLPHVLGARLGAVESGDLRDHWYPAINLGGSVQFRISDWFEVSPGIEYNLYLFKSFHQQTFAGPSVLTASSGRPSHALRLTVDARFVDHASGPTRYFVLTGLGYVVRKFGGIDLTWSHSYAETHFAFEPKHDWVQTFGFGVQHSISGFYSLDLGMKCCANYRDPVDLSINIGVTYRFNEWGLAP